MLKKLLIGLSLLMSQYCWAFDIYNPSTNQLTIPSVMVENTIYNNVVVKVGEVLSVGGSGGFRVQEFVNKIYSRSRVLTLNSVPNKKTAENYQIILKTSSGNDAYVESKRVNTKITELSILRNDQLIENSVEYLYVSASNSNIRVSESTKHAYKLYGSHAYFSTANNSGEFGFLMSSVNYENTSKTKILDYSSYYYSLEPSEDGKSTFYCETGNTFNPSSPENQADLHKFCFKIDNNGELMGDIKAWININGYITDFIGSIE